MDDCLPTVGHCDRKLALEEALAAVPESGFWQSAIDNFHVHILAAAQNAPLRHLSIKL